MVLKKAGRTSKEKIVPPQGEMLKQTRDFIITTIQIEAYPLEINFKIFFIKIMPHFVKLL